MTPFCWISILFFTSLVPVVSNTKNTSSQRSYEASSQVSQGNQTRPLGRHIIIASLEAAPFMMKRHNNGTLEWYGYCMDLFKELIKHLPYRVTYEIYQVSDNKFGSKSKEVVSKTNSSDSKDSFPKSERWTGLIGDLQRGRAHLALAPLAVMAERELAVDFTVPFYDLVGIQILLKKPEVPQDWFKFLAVLDNEVWFSITIAYFVTSFVIFLFDRLSPYSHKNLARIRKLKHNDKGEKEVSGRMTKFHKSNIVDSVSKNLKHQDGGNMFVVGAGKRNPNNLPNDFLAKSHQVFVGPQRKPSHTSSMKSKFGLFLKPTIEPSAFSLTSAHPVFYEKSESNHLEDNSDLKAISKWPQHHIQRGSTTFSDYIKGIDLKKSASGWEDEEADNSELDDGKPDFGFRDSLWFCITSLTPQGGGEAPQNLSGRVVAGAWWLFCFIIIASYTANLAAYLTVSRLDIPIENLDDLVKQYRIKYAPVDGTAEQTYFKRMAYIEEIFYNIWKEMSLNNSLSEEERSKFAVWDYPISDKYTKIWAQIQQVGMPADTQVGIRRVKSSSLDDGFALLADANVVKYAVMTDCNLKAVGEEFSRKPIALGVRRGDNQFRDDLSYAILQLINQRFMEVLREKWWTNNPDRVTCDSNDESEGISIENIGGVFIIILSGVILSFLVWAVERFVYKTKIYVSRDLIQRS